MKLKIISDGTRQGTRVVNADTGEPVANVAAIEWTIGPFPGASNAARGTITIDRIPVDIVANAAIPEPQGGGRAQADCG